MTSGSGAGDNDLIAPDFGGYFGAAAWVSNHDDSRTSWRSSSPISPQRQPWAAAWLAGDPV